MAEARDYATEDQHRDAVAAYLRALARDARLVGDVAHEISFQQLWNEEHEKALFYFRRYFARHPDGVDRDVRKGLVREDVSDRVPAGLARAHHGIHCDA